MIVVAKRVVLSGAMARIVAEDVRATPARWPAQRQSHPIRRRPTRTPRQDGSARPASRSHPAIRADGDEAAAHRLVASLGGSVQRAIGADRWAGERRATEFGSRVLVGAALERIGRLERPAGPDRQGRIESNDRLVELAPDEVVPSSPTMGARGALPGLQSVFPTAQRQDGRRSGDRGTGAVAVTPRAIKARTRLECRCEWSHRDDIRPSERDAGADVRPSNSTGQPGSLAGEVHRRDATVVRRCRSPHTLP